FFRGFLQRRFGLIISSLLFAMSHFNYGLPFMIVGVFTISLVIGRTFERTGDLLPCIVAHGIFDAVQLIIVLPVAVRMWPTVAGEGKGVLPLAPQIYPQARVGPSVGYRPQPPPHTTQMSERTVASLP